MIQVNERRKVIRSRLRYIEAKKFVGKWIVVLKTLYAVGNERLGDAPR